MILGTGIDLLHIARMDQLWHRYQQRLLMRILHADEQNWFLSVPDAQQGRWLAKRWAAKEAAAKALGTGFRNSVVFSDFIYDHDALGKPLLRVVGAAKQHADAQGIQAWHLSVSDEKDHVIAMVIAEGIRS